MTTSFTLSIGYISHGEFGQDSAWAKLKDTVELVHIHHFWTPIIKELHAHYPQWLPELIKEYTDIYSAKQNCPLVIDEENRCIVVMCSGGGESRRIKEVVAMAFCRAIIWRMNLYHEIPVCLSVA